MATLRDYFDADFTHGWSNAGGPETLHAIEGPQKLQFVARWHLDYDTQTKWVSFYLIDAYDPLAACITLARNPKWALDLVDGLNSQPRVTIEEQPHTREFRFCGRVFIYAELSLTAQALSELAQAAREVGVDAVFRGPAYALVRSAREKPLAFISHDSRDKAEIARPLVSRLSRLACPVWFDEYSLQVGARLRESIEMGLKECKKCILVLSKNFLANTGWTKAEFNAVFTREILESSDYILPLWVDVTKKDIYDYSPALLNRLGAQWCDGIDTVARKLVAAIFGHPPVQPMIPMINFGDKTDK